MPPRLRSILISVLALAWFFGMIALYYAGHKPFDASLLLSLLQTAGRLIVALGLLALAGGLGRKLYSPNHLHPLAQMALQGALGLGVFSLVILLVGAFLGLQRWLLWATAGFLVALLWRQVLAWGRQVESLKELLPPGDRFSRVVAIILGLLALCALLIALAPPIQFDALMYHLALPNIYLQLGKVTYLPWMVLSGHPQNAEMLYTWAIALGGTSAAATMGWGWSLLTVLGLLGYLSQSINRPAAWVGVGALLGGYSLIIHMAAGYVDWLGLLFGFGCLVCLGEWRQNGRWKDALLAGLFAGLALGTKYPGGTLGLVGLCALGWHTWRTRRNFLPALGCYGLGGLAALPWLLKNLFTTGNPVYPFLFASGAMDAVRMAVYQGRPPWGNWLDFLLLPVRAMYLGFDDGPGYGVSQGPLLIGLGALACLGWKERSASQRIALENTALFALLGWLVWATGLRINGFLVLARFYYPFFPAFAALAAFGYWGLSLLKIPQVRMSRLAQILVLLVLALNLVEVGLRTVQLGALPYLLAQKDEQQYLADNLGWLQPAMKAVRELPEGSKALLLFEPRSLYCLPRCYPDEILDRWKREAATGRDPEGILKDWRKQSFTHVLYYKVGADFMRETADPHYNLRDWQALDIFLTHLPKPVDFGGVYWLYDLSNN